MPTQNAPDTGQTDQELDRISQDLREQVRMAKDRISDRYAKLMEERSFDTDERREA